MREQDAVNQDFESQKMADLFYDLEKAQSRRRFPDWQPTPPQGELDSSFPKRTLWRILEFIDLEVTVGTWINLSANDKDYRGKI